MSGFKVDVHRDQGKDPVGRDVARPRKRAPGSKPWKVYYRLNPSYWWVRGWHVHGAYARLGDAVEGFRTVAGREERRDVEDSRRWAYRLVGPKGEEVALYQPDWDASDSDT